MEYKHEAKHIKEPTGQYAIFPEVDNALWGMFEEYLVERDLDYKLAKANKWYPTSYDVPRIVMPARKREGTFWQARLMELENNSGLKRWDSPNVAREDAIIAVIPEEPREVYRTAIVEGPMDALAVAGLGCLGLATCGNKPTDLTIRHILELTTEFGGGHLWVLPDSDSLGAGVDIQNKLTRFGCISTIVNLAPFKDFAEIPKAVRMSMIEGILKKDL